MVGTEEPTRLILTQLPPTLTAPLLRAHLERCPPTPPTITDCKVLVKPDGKSRRVAFAGFKTHRDADRVRSWADRSWVAGAGTAAGGTIHVEWAKDSHDAPPSKKRARLEDNPASKTPSPFSKKPKQPSVSVTSDDSSRFAEFMAVMAAPKKSRALEDHQHNEMNSVAPPPATTKAPVPPAEDPSSKSKPSTTKPEQSVLAVVEEAPEEAAVPRDNVADDDTISDMEYMARRMKRRLEVEAEEALADELGSREEEPKERQWEQDAQDGAPDTSLTENKEEEEEVDSAVASLTANPRLFVRNLPFTVTESELVELFEPFGDLDHVHIPLDATTKKSKGLAYASFRTSASAIESMKKLDGRPFQGRLLHILPSIEREAKPPPPLMRNGESTSSVKAARDQTKKQEASTGISWATLYMNPDAVISSVADRFKIDKAQLLDPSSDNAAVRVALAETHVIRETKTYFEDEGVNLDALNTSLTKGPRSSTTILVKNIPYGTTRATLNAMFSEHGEVKRLLLPPAGTMAIVEMVDADATTSAWKGLIYKKLGGSVIFLEKAPKRIWDVDESKKKKKQKEAEEKSVSQINGAANNADDVSGLASASASASTKTAAPGATLFIKNLSFMTTTEKLASAFSILPEFISARVQTKPDPKRQGQTLSMGFGFVAFSSVQGAQRALDVRNGYLLDGHKLEVKFAQRGRDDKDEEEDALASGSSNSKKKKAKGRDGDGTKLIVKNVPFEATKKDLRELFSAYGQLRSVRLPRKLDRHTRGFGFLDFVSHQEAVSAFDALEHTHLLGRHLVLQWADNDDGGHGGGAEAELEALRKRTAQAASALMSGANSGGAKTALGKKKKFVMTEPGATGAGKSGVGGEMDDDDE